MRKQWGKVHLGQLFEIKHGYAFKSRYFSNSGPYIVLTPGNFHDIGGYKSKKEEKYYTGEFPERYILKQHDLIIAMTEQGEGLLGSSAFVPADNLYLHNQRLGLVTKIDGDKADKQFLYHLFNYRAIRQKIRATASGVKVRHTSPSRICEIEIICPDVSSQRKIAAILSTYDNLIENNNRRIKLLEEMARLIYKEWFVNIRFPGHEDVKMVDSSLGQIPEGWEVKEMKDVASINEINLKKEDGLTPINYIDISSVSPGSIDNIESMLFKDAPGRARRVVRHGDTIWSTVRPNRKSFAPILNPIKNLIVSTGFAVITPKKVPYSYAYEYLTTDNYVSYMVNHAKGSAYPAVSASDVEQSLMLVPEETLLNRFHNIESPMFEEINYLKKKNNILRQTRDLLLPKLISGELDVSELVIDTGDEAE